MKDTTRALEDYNQGIRTNYYDPNGYNRRGSLYLSQKKYDLAKQDFDRAIGYDSTFIPAYFNRRWSTRTPGGRSTPSKISAG